MTARASDMRGPLSSHLPNAKDNQTEGELDFTDDDEVPPNNPLNQEAKESQEDPDSAVEEDEEIQSPEIVRNLSESEEQKEEKTSSKLWSKPVFEFAEKHLFSRLAPRWRNWFMRGISGLLLISGFSILVSMGTAGMIFVTYLVTISSMSEITSMAKKVCNPQGLSPVFSWSVYACLQFYLFGKELSSYLVNSTPLTLDFPMASLILEVVEKYHLLISFSIYISTVIYFVATLDTDYLRNYAFFAWIHMALLCVAIPGYLLINLSFEGLIWFVLPMSVITLNDIAAFYVGFFAGRTPLTKLSPKKTMEGFVGGGILTILLGIPFCRSLVFPFLICPTQINPLENWSDFSNLLAIDYDQCQTQSGFFENDSLTSIHWFVLCAVFSLIGPFAGFFASGFKRSCNRKNFGSFIPGHGGVTDRCDCMFLSGVIMHVYYHSFIKPNFVQSL